MTYKMAIKSPILILTIFNVCLCLIYYFTCILILDLPKERLPFTLEFPTMLIMSAGPLYLVLNKHNVNFVEDITKISIGSSSKSSGIGATILGYFGAIFMLFVWIGKIYFDLL